MTFGAGRARVNMQFTEISSESLVGFCIQRLIAEEQDLVIRQRLMQLLDLTVAERLRERGSFDIGADARRNRRDIYGFIAHGTVSCYSTFAPENLTTLAHFSVSAPISVAKSAAEP